VRSVPNSKPYTDIESAPTAPDVSAQRKRLFQTWRAALRPTSEDRERIRGELRYLFAEPVVSDEDAAGAADGAELDETPRTETD